MKTLRGYLAKTVSIIILMIAVPLILSLCLGRFVDENGKIKGKITNLVINGTGTSFPLAIYLLWFKDYSAYLQETTNTQVDYVFSATGSGTGQKEFFKSNVIWGATTSDTTNKSYQRWFLPANVTSLDQVNITNYRNPDAPKHLGAIQFPTNAGAIGIVYNVPELMVDGAEPLIFNATVLGDIFSATITNWNDPAIQELNPGVNLPDHVITGIGTTASSGSCLVFTTYLAKYSDNFKNKVGASSTPNWPESFIKRLLISDLLYVVETLQYGITYSSLDIFYQTPSNLYKLGKVKNQDGIALLPDTASILAALEQQDATFKRHNDLSITDVPVPQAYPLAITTYALIYENYYYFEDGSDSDCKKIEYLVSFWNWTQASVQGQYAAESSSWVPIFGEQLQNNLKALSLVTCNKVNIFDKLEAEQMINQYYLNDPFLIAWNAGLTFWELNVATSFATSPVSSFLYVLFYLLMFCVPTLAFILTLKEYKKSRLAAAPLIKDNEKSQADTNLKPAKPNLSNVLAVLALWVNLTQLTYLAIMKSSAVRRSGFTGAFQYSGIYVKGSLVYLNILYVAISLWIAGIAFVLVAYPFLQKHYPLKLRHFRNLNKMLTLFLPNFSTLFFNPALEMLSDVYQCRLVTDTGQYVNNLTEHTPSIRCWQGDHWSLAVYSLFLIIPFIFLNIKYSVVFHRLEKTLDFQDKGWIISSELWYRCLIIICFYNLPGSFFFLFAFLASGTISVLPLIYKPNRYIWFEYTRAAVGLLYSVISFVLFLLEVIIVKTDYGTRTRISDPLTVALLVMIIIVFVALCVIMRMKLKEELSSSELEKQKADIDKFFTAFLKEEEKNLEVETNEIVYQAEKQSHVPTLTLEVPSQLGSRGKFLSINSVNSVSKRFDWPKFLELIERTKNVGLINEDQFSILQNAAREQNVSVAHVFMLSNGKLTTFLDLLESNMWTIIALNVPSSVNPSLPRRNMSIPKSNSYNSNVAAIMEEN